MQIPSWITSNPLEILSAIFIPVIGWVYREKILLKLKICSFKFRNKTQRLKIKHIKKYKNAPINWLSNDIFHQIQKIETDTLFKKGVNKRCIHIRSEKLGLPISIWLSEEFDTSTIEDEEPKILDYIVGVNMDSDLRIGYSDTQLLQQFITTSSKIHSIINKKCFEPQEEPLQEFAICTIMQKEPFITKKKEITDEKLKAKISLLDKNKIHITESEPTYLVETVRKYFIL